MVQLRHKTLLSISGAIWLLAGSLLMWKGIGYLTKAPKIDISNSEYPLLSKLVPFLGSVESGILMLLSFALLLGYFKGKFVLGKSAKRVVDRIHTLPNPASIATMYSPQYYVLLGGMIFLGISMKYLGVPEDVRGVIDVAVGAALINGSMFYFKKVATVTS